MSTDELDSLIMLLIQTAGKPRCLCKVIPTLAARSPTSPLRPPLDAAKHPGFHKVVADTGPSQHEWFRGALQYGIDTLDQDGAGG
jgi:hypothetical protein